MAEIGTMWPRRAEPQQQTAAVPAAAAKILNRTQGFRQDVNEKETDTNAFLA